MNKNSMVAVYESNEKAEEAVRKLYRSGFDMGKLSIVEKDVRTEKDIRGYYTAWDRVKDWAGTGAFWGGVWGFILGLAFVYVAGPGPAEAAAGIVSSAITWAVAVGVLGAIGGALYSIGAHSTMLKYDRSVRADRYLVIVHGSRQEVDRGREILGFGPSVELHGEKEMTH